MTSFDSVFQDAGTLGVTVCCASGDNGSSDGVSDGKDHVDFPSSSPNVLACGGTSVQSSGGTLASETVWNNGASGGASGGGVSAVFALPSWQQNLSVTQNGKPAPLQKRGVPDVAGDADPQTGYNVRVDGQDIVLGGTSAVAPLWGALLALINSSRGTSAGFVNGKLYGDGGDFNDITSGNNGSFSATRGWDACTGLGSPNGPKIASAL
jgi:kumamolisin